MNGIGFADISQSIEQIKPGKAARGEVRGIIKVIAIHPEGDVMRHFTRDQKYEHYGGARGKFRGSPKSLLFILWAPHILYLDQIS